MSIGFPLVFGLMVLWILAGCGRTLIVAGTAFLAELRAQRIDEGTSLEEPGASMHDAESAVLGALGSLDTVRRGLGWELSGFGDPALRQRELVHACGELLRAQRAMRAMHRRRPYLALDPGEPIAIVEDPVRLLAQHGRWGAWFALMLLPRPVRRLYTFVRLRGAVARLRETATELEDRLAIVRHSGASSRRAAA